MESEIAYAMAHGLAGEDRLSPVRRMSVFLQQLLHVPDILESIQKLTHALRLSQGMEHVRAIKFKYSNCIDSMVPSSI